METGRGAGGAGRIRPFIRVMGVLTMSSSVVGQFDERDPLLVRLLARCMQADPRQVWRLALAWRGEPDRTELIRAALGLAGEMGRREEARRAMLVAARELRASPGGRDASIYLAGMGVVFRAEAAAQEAAVAAILRMDLSPEVRDALVAPWAAVFGDPFVPIATFIPEGGADA
jgi:hypothetical protein